MPGANGAHEKKGALRPPAAFQEDVLRQREAFIATLEDLDPEKLVFLDESGFKTNILRNEGWAPSGDKPVLVGSRYGKHLTLIGAIALDGVRAWQLMESTMNGPAFVSFLEEDLGPTLRPGDVVVMDGPRVHRVEGVEQALAARGASVLYLPPYSPELNPIEMCWALLKAWVRTRAPRIVDRLVVAVEEAWGRVTADICSAWVRHCGYAVPST